MQRYLHLDLRFSIIVIPKLLLLYFEVEKGLFHHCKMTSTLSPEWKILQTLWDYLNAYNQSLEVKLTLHSPVMQFYSVQVVPFLIVWLY